MKKLLLALMVLLPAPHIASKPPEDKDKSQQDAHGHLWAAMENQLDNLLTRLSTEATTSEQRNTLLDLAQLNNAFRLNSAPPQNPTPLTVGDLTRIVQELLDAHPINQRENPENNQ